MTTPGPIIILSNQCGCTIVEVAGEDQFAYCPTHAAAAELLALAKNLAAMGAPDAMSDDKWATTPRLDDVLNEARALLARLKG